MAAGYANTDKVKAIEIFNKTPMILRTDTQSVNTLNNKIYLI
jgi:hypothetical protein